MGLCSNFIPSPIQSFGMQKTAVLILCGGRSSEHEISLCSAWNLVKALDPVKYDRHLIGIDRRGNWKLQDVSVFLEQELNPRTIAIQDDTETVTVRPGDHPEKFITIESDTALPPIDVVFPILHGQNGEDGRIQGLLSHLQLPFVGPDVLASSICMDKEITKRILLQAGLPTSDYVSFKLHDRDSISAKEVFDLLGSPVFVKPSSLGSSVGIHKASNEEELETAIEHAFQFDNKIIIETFMDGREIECAVLGNEVVEVSLPGNYIHSDNFFAYETKYLKGREVVMEIPVKGMKEVLVDEARALAREAYQLLECEGMARVDIFLSPDGELHINEVNTLPGFTNTSMYPLLMESEGYSYAGLVHKLIQLALDRHKRQEAFNVNHDHE